MHLQKALLNDLWQACFHGFRAGVQSRVCQQVLQAHQRHPYHLSQASSMNPLPASPCLSPDTAHACIYAVTCVMNRVCSHMSVHTCMSRLLRA